MDARIYGPAMRKSTQLVRSVRQPIIFLCCIAAVVVLAGAAFFSGLWWPGITPVQTAKIIADDDKFGMRAVWMGHIWGDWILQPLREETGDFQNLNNRNSFWISKLLAKNPSEESIAVAYELHARPNAYAWAVGAIGLAAHSLLPIESLSEDGQLFRVLSGRAHADLYESAFNSSARLELSLIAAGYSRDPRALVPVARLVNQPGAPFWVVSRACEALGMIGDSRAVPILVEAMKRPTYYALPSAFRALIALGEKQAVPLAIARIIPQSEEGQDIFLVRELEEVTGKLLGHKRDSWIEWWQSVESTWTIPNRFLGHAGND